MKTIIWTLLFSSASVGPGDVMSSEKALLRELLSLYKRVGRLGRPVLDPSQTVTVRFSLGLLQMEVHEKDNMLILSTWANYVSTDLESRVLNGWLFRLDLCIQWNLFLRPPEK